MPDLLLFNAPGPEEDYGFTTHLFLWSRGKRSQALPASYVGNDTKLCAMSLMAVTWLIIGFGRKDWVIFTFVRRAPVFDWRL